MDDKEHYERGMAMRRKTLGAAHVDRANANKTPFNAEFQDLITRYLWGIWTRPHFDVRTRRAGRQSRLQGGGRSGGGGAESMIPKKPAPHLMRGGNRFSEKDHAPTKS